jgi:hypothetical protein
MVYYGFTQKFSKGKKATTVKSISLPKSSPTPAPRPSTETVTKPVPTPKQDQPIENPIKLEVNEKSEIITEEVVVKPKPRKKAFLAGINYIHCDDESLRLNGCINDVLSMRDVLEKQYGYKSEDIVLLRDDIDEKSKWPTYKNILNSLRNIVNESKQLDEIWIHYSGHGANIKDTNGDELDGQDEVLVPCDYKQRGVIVDDTIFTILEKSDCPVFLTIDCCHSGTISDLTYSFYPNPQNPTNFRRVLQNDKKMKNQNVYMFSGCRDDQTSADVTYTYEEKIVQEGAFTSALIEALRFHKHNVTLLQLYVTILEVLQARGFEQKVVFSSSNSEPLYLLTTSN